MPKGSEEREYGDGFDPAIQADDIRPYGLRLLELRRNPSACGPLRPLRGHLSQRERQGRAAKF